MTGRRDIRRLLLACAVAWTGGSARGAPGPEDPITLVVMDPLAARLSCPCVAGYAQRDYDALAAFLEKSLGRPVRIGYGASLAQGLTAAAGKRAHIVVGKDSAVRADAAAAGARLAAACALTDTTGSTTTSGLFVVAADDGAESVDDTIDYAIYAGPPEHVEKHDLALAALRAAGLPDPFDVHEFGSCSDAAAPMLDAEQPANIVAVVSSYAKPLLEGCGAVPPGSLRVIGETEPTRFITAFVDESIDLPLRDAIRLALLAVAEDGALLKKLESSRGFVSLAEDEGWTGWRGPGRRGHAARLPAALPEKPAVIWTQPLVHGGLGGIAATRTHVVMGDRDDADARDVFKCFDAGTGELIWQVAYDAPGRLDYGNSPRATPLIENGRVHLLGAMGDLHCVSLATGEILWRRHLVRDFSVPAKAFSAWGYCSSPLVAEGRLVVSPGAADAAVVALDPATGSELWRTPGRPTGYGSFVAAHVGGRCQVVGFDETTLGGYDVFTGRRLWEWQPPVGGGFNVPTPVIIGDEPLRLLISTETGGTSLLAVDAGGTLAPEPLAHSEDLAAEMATPVVVENRVIGVQDRLVALAADDSLRTVAVIEDPSVATYAAMISGPGKVLVIGNGGRLAMYDVDAAGLRLNSATSALPDSGPDDAKSPIYSHPALVGTRLYIRGRHELACVDLAATED